MDSYYREIKGITKLRDKGVVTTDEISKLSINEMHEKYGLTYGEAWEVFSDTCTRLFPYKANFPTDVRR